MSDYAGVVVLGLNLQSLGSAMHHNTMQNHHRRVRQAVRDAQEAHDVPEGSRRALEELLSHAERITRGWEARTKGEREDRAPAVARIGRQLFGWGQLLEHFAEARASLERPRPEGPCNGGFMDDREGAQ